jgi:L-amino acid N-acyltransferase YncA
VFHGAMTIEPLAAADWPAVAAIYAEGIATRMATFETEVPGWNDFVAKTIPGHALVARLDGEVAGWATLSRVSSRAVYSGVAENSVYVAAGTRGHGVGRALLDTLVAGAEEAGIWTIQTSIFPENTASLVLHERCGFRIVGRRERIARLDGVWRDTLLLERRSPDPTKKNGAQ